MKDFTIDQFAGRIPDADTLRLHMGEMSLDEALIAQAAYRLALVQSTVSESTVGKLIQALERAEEGLRELSRFAGEHGSCSSSAIEHVAANISQVLSSPEVRLIPRKVSQAKVSASDRRSPSFSSR